MTIKNNSLQDRLNQFKNNQSNSEFNSEETKNIDELKKTFIGLISSSLSLITLFIKSLIFGYSTKLIFNTNWNFWGFLCIGFMINILAQYIFHLIHPNN